MLRSALLTCRHLSPVPSLRRAFHTSTELRNASEVGVAPPEDLEKPTIFSKIISKEIPSDILFEDDKVRSTISPSLSYLHIRAHRNHPISISAP